MAVHNPTRAVAPPVDQLSLVFSTPETSTTVDVQEERGPTPQDTMASLAKAEQKRAKKPDARRGATAESLAKQQREISVSEFFAKNRHLLGFDSKRKALLTTVKEAVDNSLDACEEGGILPDIEVTVRQVDQDRLTVAVRDNGPGIVKGQIPNVFGKLLYGSKFHRLKMSRGQQGIGISAAGMYGLITTGKPIQIISRTSSRAVAHMYRLAIDTKKNRPDIISDKSVEVDWPHGTEVVIEIEATYGRGRQSIDEYLELTAIANPHARIIYHSPNAAAVEFERGTETLPAETKEIKPHPYGVELGTLMKMLKETQALKLGDFLTSEFSRVSPAVAKRVCEKSGVTTSTWVSAVPPPVIQKIHSTLQNTKLKAPSTNCLAPIGAEAILAGLLRGIKAEFYTASTRPPAVYRGNPFQIEVGIAYGGQLGSDHRDDDDNGRNKGDRVQARVIRFANRVPLLYQQSSCCMYKSVIDTKWNNYSLSQSSGALPQAPMAILIHMASVWVPFISEGKEAIADYDEIRKEVKLAIAECGRRLGTLLRRKRKKVAFSKRRDVFTRYINEVVEATRAITVINKESFRKSLVSLAQQYTVQADMEFDEHGEIIKKQRPGNELGLPDTIVVERDDAAPEPETLFDVGEKAAQAPKKPAKRRGRKRTGSKRKK